MYRQSLAVLLALAMIAAACAEGTESIVTTTTAAGADPGQEASPPTTAEAPDAPTADGFEFNIGLFEDLTTDNYWAYLDPESSVWNGYVLGSQAAALFTLAAPDFILVPSLAEGLAREPVDQGDGSWVIEQPLRSGVVWSDGTEITANDIVFTYRTVIDLSLGGNWLSAYPQGSTDDPATADVDETSLGLTAVEAIDDYTIRFTFNAKPGLSLWQYGVAQAAIMPAHYWGDVVSAATSAEDLYAASGVGAPVAGPWTFAGGEPGAFARNLANDSYSFAGTTTELYEDGTYRLSGGPLGLDETFYGDAAGDVKLAYTEGPFASEVTYSIYGTQDGAVLALAGGEVDYLLNSLGLPAGLRGIVLGEPDLEVVANPANSYRYLAFNTRRFPGNDTAFRQALGCMIDKDFMANDVLQGAAIPAWGQVPEGNAFWYDPNVPRPCEDLNHQERVAEATRILSDAGWTWDVEPGWDEDNRDVIPKGEGLRGPDGTPVDDLTLLAPGPGYDPLRATYSLFNVIVDRIFTDQPDFDMYILGWTLTPYPDHVADFFETSADAALGGLNTPGYSNPDLDALAAQLKTTSDVDEARSLIAEMDAILAVEQPYVVLFTTPILEAYSSSIRFPFTEVVDGIQNLNGLTSFATKAAD